MSSHRKKEWLLHQAAEAQRKQGALPNLEEAERFWIETLERVDKKKTERPAPPPSTPSPKNERPASQLLKERGTRILTPEEIKREAAEEPRGYPTPTARLAVLRLRLLYQYPDWRQRVIDAINQGVREAWPYRDKTMPFEGTRVPAIRLAVWSKVRAVLDASSAVFGDWQIAPRKKRHIYT